MDDQNIHMGGILDLATTHTDEIFRLKSDNHEAHLENQNNEYTVVKSDETWTEYNEEFSNKEIDDPKQKHNLCELPLQTCPMIWSISSSVVETPGDSGVQCLDSENSDLTGDCPAGMTHSLVEAEDLICDPSESHGEPLHVKNLHRHLSDDVMTQSDIENQNTCSDYPEKRSALKNMNDDVSPSTSTMKSASDDIVYRRKCKKKSGNNSSQPKKRVSFHEDILNNTKTDNIHIEHGFISYRPEAAMNYFPNNYLKKFNTAIGRYSWCTVGDSPFDETHSYATDRSTKSDVFTYGGTDVVGFPDNSGIYEYQNVNKCKCSKDEHDGISPPNNGGQLYVCSCSSSDSNLSSESDTSSQTLSLNLDTKTQSKKCDNTKKSYSCDCIENNPMKPLIKSMYFSDGNIDRSDRIEELQMSQVLPKASCLKKSALKKKRYITTDVIEEHSVTSNRKNEDKSKRNLLDSKNLFGSLKSMYKNINFGLSIAERGVPEGSEDCQSVADVLETETFGEKRVRGDGLSLQSSSENFIKTKSRQSDMSKQNLSLDMNACNGKTFLDWKSGCSRDLVRNKCIVNCESTVYEHKGVSYCYEYDTFQTTFDTSKDTFTPISDTAMNRSINLKEKEPDLMEVEKEDTKGEALLKEEFKQNEAMSENDSGTDNSERVKFKLSKYLLEQNENSKGASKHLSSPLKQRNVMRYEKASKSNADGKENESNFDTNSIQDTLNESAPDLDEIMEICDGFDIQTKPTRKMSLMNRFLKNVSQKRNGLQQNQFFQMKMKEERTKFPNICFPKGEKISPSFRIAAKYLDSLINKEVMENKRVSVKLMTADEPSYFDSFEENVAIECCEKLKLELFRDSSEILQRMLKIRSAYSQENGQWSPQLVFITNKALYVADVENGKYSYNLLFYLTHDQLGTIVIGPDSQYVQIFDVTGEFQCTVITADRYLCHRLVSSLEWSSRNSRSIIGNTILFGNIPSVIWKERDCLKRSLMKITSYNRYERCLFYGMVGSSAPAAFNTGRPASPFGQPMEGFLMYKTEKQRHWKPSFFLLKSGVLSYGSSTLPTYSSSSSLPHSIDLKSAIGVRRCTDINGRPYCFEIALNVGLSHLQMAAPDDDVASQWLQGLLMHAAQALEGPKSDPGKKPLPPCCSLLVSTKHIITLREDLTVQLKDLNLDFYLQNKHLNNKVENGETQPIKNGLEILSFASITDLTALKIPDNDDNWCILEFVFCEVHEGTEMGFLFASSAELERFIAYVETIWHTTNEGVFPISIQPSTDMTSTRCSEWHNHLVTAWDKLLPTAHR